MLRTGYFTWHRCIALPNKPKYDGRLFVRVYTFLQKNFENWRFWKTQFFESAILKFYFKKFFCYFIPKKISQSYVLGYQGWVEILMITLVYSKRVSVRNNLLHSVLLNCQPCPYFSLIYNKCFLESPKTISRKIEGNFFNVS